MSRNWVAALIVAACIFCVTAPSGASVEWTVQGTLDVGGKPLDVATSADGKRTFVLTDGGDILVYSADGTREEKIPTGERADGIEVSPQGDRIFLLSRENREVKVISLEFVQKIDESGSPVKGPADARVVLAVYSDFQ